jgi:hypothetical protein
MAIPPIDLSNLSFDGIKTSLKNYISSKEYFTDFDYEGSAISTILDLLTYNTYYQLVFQNILVNEMFLDSAQKIESLQSHAKLHGFLIQNKYSSKSNLTITDPNTTPISIAAYSKFEGRLPNGIVRNFYTVDDVEFSNDGTVNTATFDVYEAQSAVIKQQFTLNLDKQNCFIPNQNFDFRTITVEVDVDGTGSYEVYRRGNVVEPNLYSNTKIYYLETNGSGYDVKFVSGMIDPETGEYIGQPFTTNTAVRISYLIPSGPSANGISTITYTSPLNGATLYVNTTSAGGRETLSTDSLRFFIPRSFAAQNRNVTQADIKASLIEANFALTEDQITLTTSADEPGKIYVSISGTTPDQDALLEFLNSRGIMGIVYQYGTV